MQQQQQHSAGGAAHGDELEEQGSILQLQVADLARQLQVGGCWTVGICTMVAVLLLASSCDHSTMHMTTSAQTLQA
jgi:hypothetical protein